MKLATPSCLRLQLLAGVLALLAASPAGATDEPIPGLVTDWSLSQTAPVNDIDVERYPDAQLQKFLQWQPVQSEPTGLVDVAHLRQPFPGINSYCVYARTTLHAERKEMRAFTLGCSGALSLYLNGRVLFRSQGDGPGRDPSSSGSLGWSNTIWLSLEEGDNEVLLAVSPTAAGWSFKGRDLDAIYLHPAGTKLWELSGLAEMPESVAYDAQRQVLYTSNFVNNCICKLSLDGHMIASPWATDLKAPGGVKFSRGKLYTAERSGVAEIDPDSGTVTQRFALEGAPFPNDLCLDESGAIYVSDSQTNRIYKITDGKAELWLQDAAINLPNGLMVTKEKLLVDVMSDGTIKAVDLATKRVETYVTLGDDKADPERTSRMLPHGALLDGLVSDGKGGCLFSDYFGRIFHADAAGRKTLLLDRSGPRQFCADFEYVPDLGLLVIPSLFEHRLTAYRIKVEDL
ncbi:MAG: SMP-30/gluconolactonase/LRE family protein [Opitutaceae bacterium]|nr:SMP-30/gluconolactonase/LRE family protein [Opitutaceae bacterium]